MSFRCCASFARSRTGSGRIGSTYSCACFCAAWSSCHLRSSATASCCRAFACSFVSARRSHTLPRRACRPRLWLALPARQVRNWPRQLPHHLAWSRRLLVALLRTPVGADCLRVPKRARLATMPRCAPRCASKLGCARRRPRMTLGRSATAVSPLPRPGRAARPRAAHIRCRALRCPARPRPARPRPRQQRRTRSELRRASPCG